MFVILKTPLNRSLSTEPIHLVHLLQAVNVYADHKYEISKILLVSISQVLSHNVSRLLIHLFYGYWLKLLNMLFLCLKSFDSVRPCRYFRLHASLRSHLPCKGSKRKKCQHGPVRAVPVASPDGIHLKIGKRKKLENSKSK